MAIDTVACVARAVVTIVGGVAVSPFRCAAILVVALAAPGAAVADAPVLTADDVAELEAAPCAWRFEARLATAGEAWIERWRPEACTRTAPANIRLAETAAGELAVTRLLPGTTRQPPAVQREATLAVLARAGAPECRARRVVDTGVVAARADAVVERWTVRACGHERAFRLTFSPTDHGLAAIAVADGAARSSR
jgi:hypothetical protein